MSVNQPQKPGIGAAGANQQPLPTREELLKRQEILQRQLKANQSSLFLATRETPMLGMEDSQASSEKWALQKTQERLNEVNKQLGQIPPDAKAVPASKKSRSAKGKKGVEPLPESYKTMKIEGETTEYEVKKGDNIWKLAKGILSEGGKKPTNAEIMKLTMQISGSNQERFKSGNPNLIYPGQKLLLPKTAADAREGTKKPSEDTKKPEVLQKAPALAPSYEPFEPAKPAVPEFVGPPAPKAEDMPDFIGPRLPKTETPSPDAPAASPKLQVPKNEQPEVIPGGKGAPYGDSTAEKKSETVTVNAVLPAGAKLPEAEKKDEEEKPWYQRFWDYFNKP